MANSPNTATRTLLYAFKMSPFPLALAPSRVTFLPDTNVLLLQQLYDDECSKLFTIYPTLESGRAKTHRHTITPPGTFATPDARFSHVHIDLVGPLPPSNGSTYMLTCIHRFTRWPVAAPIPAISAETVAKAFLTHWVSNFGVSATVTTDRGSQFESTLFRELTSLLGTNRIRTTETNPQANGLVERFNRQLKTSLVAQPDPSRWSDHLPLVLCPSVPLSMPT
nr:unnamed protein product [Spirometra erinaceieuropaei]